MKQIIQIAGVGALIALSACQASPKAQEEAPETTRLSSAFTSETATSSEAKLGPDELFFAERYLQQVLSSSADLGLLRLDVAASPIPEKEVSALSFAANFSLPRLGIMSRLILKQADSDQDSQLSEDEFTKWQLTLTSGERLSHKFSPEFFASIAGDDSQLESDEIIIWLRGIGLTVKKNQDKLSAHEQKLNLNRAWEKVMSAYDADQNGSLNSQEQQLLKKDRSTLLSRLSE